MANYLEKAKKARHRGQEGEAYTAKLRSSFEGTTEKREQGFRPQRDQSDQSDQSPHPKGRARTLTVDEAIEEMARPRSGPGVQARLYREGEISRDNAIEWIACAIIHRREGEAALFSGWRRHAGVGVGA